MSAQHHSEERRFADTLFSSLDCPKSLKNTMVGLPAFTKHHPHKMHVGLCAKGNISNLFYSILFYSVLFYSEFLRYFSS